MARSRVNSTQDPGEALAATEGFLTAKPVDHNLVLTILHDRIAVPLAGRYWWARDGSQVTGFVLQSPRTFSGAVTPTSNPFLAELVDAVAADAPELPGVIGDATTAASFAGRWTERVSTTAAPREAQRIYRLDGAVTTPDVPGRLRPARATDRTVLIRWVEGFEQETGSGPGEPAASIDRLREQRLWVWDDSGPAAMALATRPIAGVARLGLVYTPPDRRRRGYAGACVAAVSELTLATEAATCILYTQLANPTSNAIYRRIGYEPVREVLSYRFGGA